jgi:Flp pilus assembly protein TadB
MIKSIILTFCIILIGIVLYFLNLKILLIFYIILVMFLTIIRLFVNSMTDYHEKNDG